MIELSHTDASFKINDERYQRGDVAQIRFDDEGNCLIRLKWQSKTYQGHFSDFALSGVPFSTQSDLEDYIKDNFFFDIEGGGGGSHDKEDIIIVLSPPDEDLEDDVLRLGFVATFKFQVLDFQTTVTAPPQVKGIETELWLNNAPAATSAIGTNENNSTGNGTPAFGASIWNIGDRLDFYTPLGGTGGVIGPGQNLRAVLTIKKL